MVSTRFPTILCELGFGEKLIVFIVVAVRPNHSVCFVVGCVLTIAYRIVDSAIQFSEKVDDGKGNKNQQPGHQPDQNIRALNQVWQRKPHDGDVDRH